MSFLNIFETLSYDVKYRPTLNFELLPFTIMVDQKDQINQIVKCQQADRE